MAKHIDRRGQQRSVSKRLSALERKVGELTKEAPARPEDAVARRAMAGEKPDYLAVSRGNASYDETVADHISRMKGRSRSDVVSDRDRGSSSPLSRPTKRK